MNDEKEDTTIYEGLLNHEEQYSIWPAIVRMHSDGKSGSRHETGMSGLYQRGVDGHAALSLRKRMEQAQESV